MAVLVTGAAGFIGANIVKALNERGITDIIAVDNLTNAAKFHNLVDCQISDYFDKRDFLPRLHAGEFDGEIDAILHQGACSDTMEHDGHYMMENNYRYSIDLLNWAQDQDVPMLYASSAATYGGSTEFREEPGCEAPLNVTVTPNCCLTRLCVVASKTALPRLPVSVTSTYMVRVSRTKAAWLPWPFTISISSVNMAK